MQLLVVLVCLTCTVFASVEKDKELWVNFKNQHSKVYQNLQEEKLRFSIFQQNLHEIEEHNKKYEAGNTTYFKGVNRFADRTKQELLAMLKRSSGSGRPYFEDDTLYQKPAGLKAPDSMDWREHGAVSPVKDQSDCGSCWAHSVTGTLEGFNYLKTYQMVTYSEQQLVDCDKTSWGCDGGDEGPALVYVTQYGIQSEETYPYEAADKDCRYNADAVALRIQGYVRVPTKDENALTEAVGTLGPVSNALDASNLFFYAGGVFTDSTCSQDTLNHAVLAVGYGYDQNSGSNYWLIKNSWSTNWGDQGYFKILRGTNECGIATDNVYPVL